MTSLRLVDKGQARRLTGYDIQEMVAHRVAQREKVREEERQALKADREAWRQGNIKRRLWLTRAAGLGAILLFIGAIYWMTVGQKVALGMACTTILFGAAIWLVLGEWKQK